MFSTAIILYITDQQMIIYLYIVRVCYYLLHFINIRSEAKVPSN